MQWQERQLEDISESDWIKVQTQYPEANFLQSPAWGKVNSLVGHKVIIAQFDQGWCLMIIKNAKRGRYLEIPGGPLMDWQDSATRTAVFEQIRTVARREKCVFVRLRPQLRANAENLAILSDLGMTKAPMHLHAEHTVILDLTKDTEQLMADMRRQTRYEVRRADKLGLKVYFGSSKNLFEEFHQVQLETAQRQHFVPPNLKMLMAEHEAFGDQARLYVVRSQDDQPIAYGLILISGIEAEYFEAASTDLNRKLPGAYALLWRAIRDLKELGLKQFNLWGIAPEGQKEHRYAGVTIFKKGFGGEVVEFVPAQDIVVQKFRYQINKIIENVRKKRRHL